MGDPTKYIYPWRASDDELEARAAYIEHMKKRGVHTFYESDELAKIRREQAEREFKRSNP